MMLRQKLPCAYGAMSASDSLGEVESPPLRAMAEEIPLDVVYEDDDLAVINKPAGMMVHAGAGATDDERNRGTLVNALLHRFGKLSSTRRRLRPGIVHRLDKATSGLIVVAKNDPAHRQLAAQFARRQVKKTYIALVHGWMKQDSGTSHQQHQPRPGAADTHDDAARGRTRSDYAVQGSTHGLIPLPASSACWK